MSWDDDLAEALQPPDPKREVFVGVARLVNNTLCVSWHGSDPVKTTWSPAFASTISSRGLAGVDGLKVIVLLPDGQPFILDMIIGS